MFKAMFDKIWQDKWDLIHLKISELWSQAKHHPRKTLQLVTSFEGTELPTEATWNIKARCFYMLEDNESALSNAEKGARIASSDGAFVAAYLIIIKSLIKTGRTSEAVARASEALMIMGNAQLNGLLFEALIADGQTKEAVKVAERSVRLYGSLKDLILLAFAYQADGRFEEAIAIAKKVSIKTKHAQDYLFLSQLYSKVNQGDAAINAARKAFERAPDDFQAHSRLVETLNDAGQGEEAIQLARKSVRMFKDLESHRILLETLVLHGRYQEALALGTQKVMLFSNDFHSQRFLAKAYWFLGHKEKAASIARKAITLRKSEEEYLCATALLMDLELTAEAVHEAKVAVGLYNSRRARLKLTQAHLANKNYRKAEARAKELQHDYPTQFHPYLLLSSAYLGLQEYMKAASAAEKAVRYSEGANPDAISRCYEVLIRSLYACSNGREAIVAAQSYAKTIRSNKAYTFLAEALRKERCYQEALEVLNLDLEAHASTLLCKAYCLMELGRFSESFTAFKVADQFLSDESYQQATRFDPRIRLHCGYLFLYRNVRQSADAPLSVRTELSQLVYGSISFIKSFPPDLIGNYQLKDYQHALEIASTLKN